MAISCSGRQVEADTIIFDFEPEHAARVDHLHADRRVLTRVLASVLERFDRAEIDGGLNVVTVAADSIELDRRVK